MSSKSSLPKENLDKGSFGRETSVSLNNKRLMLLLQSNAQRNLIPWSPEVFNYPRQILTLLNKAPGYWLQSEIDLANKPRKMQIFLHSKFGINRTTGSKVMAKKFICDQNNFLAITFESVVQLIPNFDVSRICKGGCLFVEAVTPLSQ